MKFAPQIDYLSKIIGWSTMQTKNQIYIMIVFVIEQLAVYSTFHLSVLENMTMILMNFFNYI